MRNPALPRLMVAGRTLVERDTGRAVVLRGVNRAGLEYDSRTHAGITEAEIRSLCLHHGCRVLRFPLNQDWVLRRSGYLDELAQVADWTAAHGAYTILDLQWLDNRTARGLGNFVPPLPEPESVEAWRLLAAHFKQSPHVLFDLFNEPHDRLAGDPLPLLQPGGQPFPEQQKVTHAMWRTWALALIDAVREVHADSVVLVSGVDWGYDLRGFPLERDNIVYSTHVYRARGTRWEECFGFLARTHCVFAAEWGGEAQDLAWGTRLADYLDELNIGWTAWSWTDHPRLAMAGRPTPFGRLVLDRLAV